MNDDYKFRYVGGAWVITIPQQIVRQLAINKETVGRVTLEGKTIQIKPLPPAKERRR